MRIAGKVHMYRVYEAHLDSVLCISSRLMITLSPAASRNSGSAVQRLCKDVKLENQPIRMILSLQCVFSGKSPDLSWPALYWESEPASSARRMTTGPTGLMRMASLRQASVTGSAIGPLLWKTTQGDPSENAFVGLGLIELNEWHKFVGNRTESPNPSK